MPTLALRTGLPGLLALVLLPTGPIAVDAQTTWYLESDAGGAVPGPDGALGIPYCFNGRWIALQGAN